MTDKKISELTAITGDNLSNSDLFPVVDVSVSETRKITFTEFKNALDSGSGFVRLTGSTMTGTLVVPSLTANGNITVTGNVDGRDVSVDGIKLDGIEAGADVTDTANVTAAGALMDSELTNLTAVKAINQGLSTTSSPSFAGISATTATISGGTINGTSVGATTPAAGTFTSVTNNSGQLYSLRLLRIFTSGTAATYTPTTGTKAIRVTIIGGGGGGGFVSAGGTAGTGGAGGGGGAGAVSSIVITSLSASYTYTVGGGGAGGVASTSTAAANGGTTTFSGGVVSLSAAGGSFGVSRTATAGSNAGRGGAGGTPATGGTLNFAGQNGATGLTIAGGSSASGGDGASGPYGAGGLGLVSNGANGAGNGLDASGYGAGGGGAGCFGTTATTANGGDGSGGIIIVEELG